MMSSYVTLVALKQRLGIQDTADDAQLTLSTVAASMAIERFTGRYFYQQTATQVFPSDDIQTLYVPDLVSITTLAVDTTGNGVYSQVWAAGDYRLEPRNAMTERGEPWPYTRIRALTAGGGRYAFPYTFPLSNPDRVQIAGVWGWPAVPALVGQVALVLAQDIFKSKDQTGSDVEGAAFLGTTKIGSSPVLRDMLSTYRSAKAVGV